MIHMLDIKNQIRKSAQWPRPQAWQVQGMCVARRARGRIATKVDEGLLQRIDKPHCCRTGILAEVVSHGIFDILGCLCPWYDGYSLHTFRIGLEGRRALARKASK